MASSTFNTTANREMLENDSSGKNKLNLRDQLIKREPTEANVLGLWYDWFCQEKSLFNRGKRLWSAAKSIVESPKFKADDCYVFFKNNCPAAVHPLYDDFRICDRASGDVLFAVSRNAWGFAGWQVFDIKGEGGGSDPAVEGSWSEVKAWFLAQPQLKIS